MVSTMITAESAIALDSVCSGCAGSKGQPLVASVIVGPGHTHPDLMVANDAALDGRTTESVRLIQEHYDQPSRVITLVLCAECGRDLANAVGFMCIREGGWSKLEPRKRKAAR